MKGWLVVNSFLQTPKFLELYHLLQATATQKGICLQRKTNGELVCNAGGEFVQSPGERPDFVLFWDKDILLARRLEGAGLPVFNSAEAIDICDDKAKTAFACRHLPMPQTVPAPFTYENVGYTDSDFLCAIGEQLGYPMIIKETKGSFGLGVYLAENAAQAREILAELGGKPVLFQKFIAESRGRDIRINVAGGRVHSAMLRENLEDFRSNITGGGQGRAYTPTQAECHLAVQACRAIGLTFGGVDILQSADGPLLCEVNSNPHFKSTLELTGADFAPAIFDAICEKIGVSGSPSKPKA